MKHFPSPNTQFRKLSAYNLSHLLLIGNTTDFSGTPLEKLAGDGMFQHFRPLFKGTLIANVKRDRDRGNRLIVEGLADLVAFGRPYIANPDLVQRFRENVPLAEVDWDTVYASGPRGYTDYPTYQPSQENPGTDEAKHSTPTPACLFGLQPTPEAAEGIGWPRQSFSSKRAPMSSSRADVRRNSTSRSRQSEPTFLAFKATLLNNVRGTLFTVQKASPLLKDGGSIILNGSVASVKGTAAFGAYAASKAAIRSFVRTWTTDLKDRGIRSNVVSPGPINTPLARFFRCSQSEVRLGLIQKCLRDVEVVS